MFLEDKKEKRNNKGEMMSSAYLCCISILLAKEVSSSMRDRVC